MLLGDRRVREQNILPEVVTWERNGRESNSRRLERESNAITGAPTDKRR